MPLSRSCGGAFDVENKNICFVRVFLWTTSALGLEIYLKNCDKITGVVVGEDTASLLVQTLATGEIKIFKAYIDLPKTYPEKYTPPKILQKNPAVSVPAVEWKKDMTLGYTQNGGNTRKQLGQFSTLINRKTATNEATLKLDTFYSATNGKMDGKKFYGMSRYAYSFGSNLKWYNFYEFEGDQDYFSDIYYRGTPSLGVGYWFSNTDSLKAMIETGVGYQYTVYRDETPSRGETVLVPRFFIDKRLIANLHLSEDLTFYPSVADFKDYRIRSETDLVNQITQRWSCKISYIDDFNSAPPSAVKKNDYTWVTSLEYHF